MSDDRKPAGRNQPAKKPRPQTARPQTAQPASGQPKRPQAGNAKPQAGNAKPADTQPARSRAQSGQAATRVPGGAGPAAPAARSYPIGTPWRYVSYVVLAVLGVACGVAGCLLVTLWTPGGLLIGLAGAVALFLGGGLLTGTRTGAALPAVFWFASLLYAAESRPEGDYLLGAGATSYVLLFVGALAGVICATLPALSSVRQAARQVGGRAGGQVGGR